MEKLKDERTVAELIKDGVFDVEEGLHTKDPQAYKEQRKTLREGFRLAVIAELGIFDHPRGDALMNLAWDRGHSEGLHSVLIEARDLVDLIR